MCCFRANWVSQWRFSHYTDHYLSLQLLLAETSEDVFSCQKWRKNCERPVRFAVLWAAGCKSLMEFRGCRRCGGSRVVGVDVDVGVDVRELMAAAVVEEACSEESRGEMGPH